MSNKYFLEYRNQSGDFLGYIDDFESLIYGKRENEMGALELIIPEELFPGELQVDFLLDVYRQIGAGMPYLDLETSWFIRKWNKKKKGEANVLTIIAEEATSLLGRRIVAYASGSSEAKKTNQADDMMKEIVEENFGSTAGGSRDISTYLSIQTDLTLAPSITKSFSWRNALSILQEIAQTSYEEGTYLIFDVVRTGVMEFEFRTYIDYRGTDQGINSDKPLVISTQNKLLSQPEITFDYSVDQNYVYVGGRGEAVDRIIVEVEDTERSTMSLLNRVENFLEYRMSSNIDSLTAAGEAELKDKNRRIFINGIILDSEEVMYGRDYNYGDLVVAQYDDIILNAHVVAIKISVIKGDETIETYIRGE